VVLFGNINLKGRMPNKFFFFWDTLFNIRNFNFYLN